MKRAKRNTIRKKGILCVYVCVWVRTWACKYTWISRWCTVSLHGSADVCFQFISNERIHITKKNTLISYSSVRLSCVHIHAYRCRLNLLDWRHHTVSSAFTFLLNDRNAASEKKSIENTRLWIELDMQTVRAVLNEKSQISTAKTTQTTTKSKTAFISGSILNVWPNGVARCFDRTQVDVACGIVPVPVHMCKCTYL